MNYQQNNSRGRNNNMFHKPKLSQLSIGSNMLSSEFGFSKTPNN